MRSTRHTYIIIFTTLLSVSMVPFGWYADESNTPPCNTCGAPSPQVQDMINLANGVMGVLPSYGSTLAQWSRFQVYGPRQWWLYQGIVQSRNPQTILWNVTAGILKNLDRQQSQLRGAADLGAIYTEDIIRDGSLWFVAITQPWPIVRDYQYLLDVDTLIGDKIYDISTIGWYGRQLTPDQISAIRTLFSTYKWEDKLFQEIKISDTITSTQALSFLMRLNHRHKNTLVLWSVNNPDMTFGGSMKGTIINAKYLDDLIQAYSCARIQQQCSSDFKTFTKNINNISKTFVDQGPAKARDKISTASKRLATRSLQIIGQGTGDFYKNNIADYERREQEILSSQPWGRNLTKRTGKDIITGIFQSNIRINLKTAWQNTKKETLWIRNTISSVFKRQPSREKVELTSSWLISPQDIDIGNMLAATVLRHNQARTSNIDNNTENIQIVIWQMLAYIRATHNQINKWIYNDIAMTCELQCSNLWWTCRSTL